jgi:RND family efflux transporter MFP subunit
LAARLPGTTARTLVPVLTALALAGGAWQIHAQQTGQPQATVTGAASPASIQVETLVVHAGQALQGQDIDGQLQAVKQATVAAQTGGNLTALLVKAGDRVRAGQLLARVDDRAPAAGLAQTEAAVTQADTVARLAHVQVERQRQLRAQGFISQAALDDAEAQLKAADAGLAQAQAARSQAALAKGFAQVIAPFDGVVQATLVEAGDLAGPGRPLLTMYAPGALRAVVQIPASQAGLWRQRLGELKVGLGQGGSEGSLRWVSPVRRELLPLADAVAQTVELRLDLAPADTRDLVPGLNVRVRLGGEARAPLPAAAGASNATDSTTFGGSTALMVPASALLQRGELTAVYVAGSNHQFSLRQVRVGQPVAGQWPVLAGLRSGETVAANAIQAGLAGAQGR